jgi:hypothetical protein
MVHTTSSRKHRSKSSVSPCKKALKRSRPLAEAQANAAVQGKDHVDGEEIPREAEEPGPESKESLEISNEPLQPIHDYGACTDVDTEMFQLDQRMAKTREKLQEHKSLGRS